MANITASHPQLGPEQVPSTPFINWESTYF